MMEKIILKRTVQLLVLTGIVFPFVSFASCIEPQNATLDDLFSSKELALGLYKKEMKEGKASYELYLGNEFAPFTLKSDFCQSEFSQLDGKNDGYVFLAQNRGKSIRYVQAIQSKESAVARFTEASNMYEGIQSGAIQHVDLKETIFYKKPDMTLRPGMEGEEVKKLQQALKVKLELGDDFKLDGKYGPATTQAVKRLQQMIGIEEDGIAGEKTLSALVGVVIGTQRSAGGSGLRGEEGEQGNNVSVSQNVRTFNISLPANIVLRIGSEGEEVKQLQQALKEWLHLDDTFAIDGKYGPMTAKAVKRLQRTLSVVDDGVFGPKTYAAFLKTLGKDVQESSVQSQEMKQDDSSNKTSQDQENQDTPTTNLDRELKALLLRAKNELLSLRGGKEGVYSSVSAYEKVIRYNNDILHASKDADPLYISLDGGSNFVYTLKLPSGAYACVDGNADRELKELDTRPAGQEVAGCE